MIRRMTTVAGALVVATALAVPAAHAAPQPSGDLKTDLDKILSDERLKDAKVGVVVRETNGTVLYERGTAEQQTPASNNKLYTSTAALGYLGAGYRFRTSVHAKQQGTAVKGDLYLKGKGDPTMRQQEYDKLAAAVAAKGIKKVEGNLVADDTWFDAQRTPPDWDPTDLPYAYAPQTSALTVAPDTDYDVGSIKVTVTPAKEGEPVKIGLTPKTSVVKIENKAMTGKAGSEPDLDVTRQVPSNTIAVTGSLPAGGEKSDRWSTVDNPTLYAADVFRKALEAHGVKVTGDTVRGKKPAGVGRVTRAKSMALSKLTTPFLKQSNNGIAETLVKTIGREEVGKGTWPEGLNAIEDYVEGLDVDGAQLKMTDGSGLGHTNKTTVEQSANLLKAARAEDWYPAWRKALPVAGNPDPMIGGTLASRMTNTPAADNVKAKTGTLTGATALSGYVKDPEGTPLIFSITFNDYQGSAPKDIEDKIAIRLAGGEVPNLARYSQPGSSTGKQLECSWLKTC